MSPLRPLFLGRPRLLASFSWKAVGAFLLFALALSAWTWFGVLLAGKEMTAGEQLEYFLVLLQRTLANYFPAFVLVTLADRVPLRAGARRVLLGAALVVGVLLAVQVRCAINPYQVFHVYYGTPLAFCSALPSWRTYLDFPGAVVPPLMLGAAVMAFVFGRRRDAELAAALRRARGAQLEAQRARIESDLAAMRSRIDPDAFFDRLGAIRARYDGDLEGGEAMLDELIDELRRASRPPPQAAPA